jgi:PAS domain S-box-containing protein
MFHVKRPKDTPTYFVLYIRRVRMMEHLGILDPRLVLNSIYNGIVVIDANGIINYFNKMAEKIFDIPAHEALDRYILDILPNTGGKLLECLETGKPFCGEKLKGENVNLISNISPIFDNGKISGVTSIFQDIFEIETISRELDLFKNMKNWLDTVIDSSFDGIMICDREGRIVRYNKASGRINDVKGDELIGKNLRELIAEGRVDKVVTFEVLRKRRTVTIIQRNKMGKRILLTGNPIFDENGEIAFVMTNERDIQELDNLRSELQETQALAKEYVSKLSELEMKGVDLSNLIIRSRKMQRVVEMAVRVARVDSTIFLLGESGVGKNMVAKVIHKQSDRRKGPFIQVDCAGIPESLIESELFGYEKGAFTGAKSEGKPGFFEMANNGTLFLDEIGELSMSSQAKLLRFLEDHEIIHVGGTKPKHINVRIIAATNKNIEELVAAKIFRRDLFYRLSIIPIHIPPLRERREDILPLIMHFLGKFNRIYQKEKILSPETTVALCRYDFPGNIRELANLIERLVVISEEDCIEMHDFPNEVIGLPVKDAFFLNLPEDISLKEALDRCERFVIEKSMKKYGSQRKAAKILRVDHATISRKMKKPFSA